MRANLCELRRLHHHGATTSNGEKIAIRAHLHPITFCKIIRGIQWTTIGAATTGVHRIFTTYAFNFRKPGGVYFDAVRNTGANDLVDGPEPELVMHGDQSIAG